MRKVTICDNWDDELIDIHKFLKALVSVKEQIKTIIIGKGSLVLFH